MVTNIISATKDWYTLGDYRIPKFLQNKAQFANSIMKTFNVTNPCIAEEKHLVDLKG